MLTLEGIATSRGLVTAPLLLLGAHAQAPKMRTVEDPEAEIRRVDAAIATAKTQLEELQCKTAAEAGDEAAAIFEIHAMMLEDEDYLDAIHGMIRMESLCAEYAVHSAGIQFSSIFSNLDDDYMKERAADVVDLSARIAGILTGEQNDPLAQADAPVVVAAEELLPSQTIQLDKSRVAAFVTRTGAFNSHASILARSLGIAAVAALGDGFSELRSGETVIVDGIDGLVICEPDAATEAEYAAKRKRLAAEALHLETLRGQPAVTLDGQTIELCANIGHPEEAAEAEKQDAEGIGLFRSEFLYLEGKDFPSEEVQFAAYQKALESMAPHRVVVRTLDLGADKQAPYFKIPQEENPALGYRAIRISLDRVNDIFVPQLRALLRASVYGRLAIMFPMITSVQEVRSILCVLDAVKKQLREEKLPYREDVEIGIMIETPAAVMLADRLAAEVDFFSIGTNDLTQYSMAADRMNPRISYLFDSGSPAILRMIRHVTQCAHKAGIWVGICGESAADPALVPYYVGMGVDELSMSAPSILRVKACVRSLRAADCRSTCAQTLD